MEELIKIRKSPTTGNPIVDARELYDFLEVGKKFPTWIKNKLETYEFIEDVEYARIFYDKNNVKVPTFQKGNIAQCGFKTYRVEYALTLDCAKEIAMVQNNVKGKQARRYFIEVEKDWKKIKSEPIPVLSNTTHTIAEVAKLLNENKTGKKVSSHKINQVLRINGYFKPNKQPYQKWINQGLFSIEQYNLNYYSAKRITVTDNKGLPVIQQLFGQKQQLSPVVIKNNNQSLEPTYNNQTFLLEKINEGRLTRLEETMLTFINHMLASKNGISSQIEVENYRTKLKMFKMEVEKQNSNHKSIELI
jgi:phage anti-repressor protein